MACARAGEGPMEGPVPTALSTILFAAEGAGCGASTVGRRGVVEALLPLGECPALVVVVALRRALPVREEAEPPAADSAAARKDTSAQAEAGVGLGLGVEGWDAALRAGRGAGALLLPADALRRPSRAAPMPSSLVTRGGGCRRKEVRGMNEVEPGVTRACAGGGGLVLALLARVEASAVGAVGAGVGAGVATFALVGRGAEAPTASAAAVAPVLLTPNPVIVKGAASLARRREARSESVPVERAPAGSKGRPRRGARGAGAKGASPAPPASPAMPLALALLEASDFASACAR